MSIMPKEFAMDYKLTVIMSNYNQEKYIEQAIKSVLMQKTNFCYQLLITDDHSTEDNSLEIIKKYEHEYPDIIRVLYNQENGRYLKNILRAKAIMKTPYFALLDADDYYLDDNFLQKGVDFLESHQDYTIYNANCLALFEDGHSLPYVITKKQTAEFSMSNYLDNSLLFSQTTGMLFKNVVYINGIPDIIQSSIGTRAERSFEGDVFRYVQHLACGKSHFVNELCGVYRILQSQGGGEFGRN